MQARHRSLRAVLLVPYLLLVLVIAGPVILAPVGADDSYWILETAPLAHGNVFTAWIQPVLTTFDFIPQDRATSLSFADRQAFATLAMNVATTFGVSPVLVWALAKVALLAASVLAVRALLLSVRYRDRSGEVRRLSRRTVGAVTLALPLLIVVGVKAQTLGTFNGWNQYPTLTYGLFPVVVLLAAGAMRLTDLLDRSYKRWVAPAVLAILVVVTVSNFGYELLVITVPVVIVAAILRPHPREGGLLTRWRGAATVAGVYTVGWGAVYGLVQLAIGARDCEATNSCYEGTQIQVRPGTVIDNLLGSLPLGTSDQVRQEAMTRGVPFPGPGGASVLLGLLAVVLLAGLLVLWWRSGADDDLEASPDEHRGLVAAFLILLGIALGCSLITGVTERAVETITSPLMSYRVGPVVWIAVAAAVTLGVVGVLRVAPKAGLAAFVVVSLIAVATVSVNFPRNVLSAQVNRASTSWVDRVQNEVALGQRGKEADERRCALLAERADQENPSSRTIRVTNGAYIAFSWYHHRPFCSEKTGFLACPTRHWAKPDSKALPCMERD